MRRFLTYFGVVRLLILLQTATLIASLDTLEFSDKFRQVVENILGVPQYEEYLSGLRSDFSAVAPNGEMFTKMVAEDISREVGRRADAVRRIRNAIVHSFAELETTSRQKCCKHNLNYTVDPRFPGETVKELCYIGKAPKTAEPAGVGDGTFDVMKRNLQLIPSLKWQYFGNEHGTLYVYPGFPGCKLDTWDPRFRPWYGFTATYPKDMVIMIDKSQEMKKNFGDKPRMSFGIQAVNAVIDSLNSNDNIGVIAFADDVEFPRDPCYRQGLALATTKNKEKLQYFAVRVQPSSSPGANFSNAFAEAFRLLGSTDNSGNDTDWTAANNKRDKVIILVSAGESSEQQAVVEQTIRDGKQLVGHVSIIAFGLDVADQSPAGEFLKAVSDGLFTAMNDPDEQTVRRQIGVYYNHLPRTSHDETVVFSVPYNDTGGLGMITSGCLPVFAVGEFRGVACIDVPMDTLFSPIIDFRLEQLSYAFLVDSRGRVLLHPLLPQPETYKKHPIFLDMQSVEISKETPAIKRSMISGVAGKMSTTHLKLFPRRGDSPLEGVGIVQEPATYFWHPISEMNASIVVVIVGEETNVSLSWTKKFPPVLLTDEITVSSDRTHLCNNFGRIAVRDKSAVKLSLQSVTNPYFYREQGIGRNAEAVKSYLEGKTDRQGSLAVKVGIRESVAMTYELERIWKRSAAAVSNSSINVLHRYVGTRDGVYRVYPAVRVPVKFDPTQQPQYRRSEVQRQRITLYTQTDASGFATTSLTKAFTDQNSDNVVLGVIGADVIFAPLFRYLRDNFDPCKNSNDECFAIDRSGFVVIHKDFVDNPPRSQVHITAKEPEFAADLVRKKIMNDDSCVSYADVTNQLFWKIEFSHNKYLPLTNGYIYDIIGFDLFVIVKYTAQSKETGTCTCHPARSNNDKSECTAGSTCQCPCYTPTDYSYCSGHFTITDTTKTCYPATLPLYLPDLTSEERDVAKSLPRCLPCSSFKSKSECVMVGCCFTGTECALCSGPPGSSSCNSVCLGLVIGLVLAVLLIVVVVVVVIVVVRRRQMPWPHWQHNPGPAAGGSLSRGTLNTTIIQVQNSYEDNGGYSNPDSVRPLSADPVYLHMDSPEKPLNEM